MRTIMMLAITGTALTGLACKKADATTGRGETTSAAAARATGLNDPANNPEVVAAAKTIMEKCGWDTKKAFEGCTELRAGWWDKKFEKVDATLANFVDDPDVKVRWLGANGLANWGYAYRADKPLAARLVAALEREPADSTLDAQMTYLLVNVTDTELMNGLKDYALKPTTAFDVKAVLTSWWYNDMGYDVLKSLANGDKRALKEVAQGYATNFDKHRDEACKFWTDHLEDDAKEVRTVAVGHLTGGWSGNNTSDSQGNWYVSGGGGGPSYSGDKTCDDKQVEHALTLIEARVKANTIDDSNYIYGLKTLTKHGHTPAIKKRAEAELVAIIATKGARERGLALSQLVDADEKQLALAKKYEKDDELKSTATYIVNQKAKKN